MNCALEGIAHINCHLRSSSTVILRCENSKRSLRKVLLTIMTNRAERLLQNSEINVQ